MNPSEDLTPEPHAVSVPSPPVSYGVMPAPPSNRSGVAPLMIAGAVTLGIFGSLGALIGARWFDRRAPLPRSSVTVVQATPPNPPMPTPAPPSDDGIPTISVDALPIVPATKGTLRLPESARGHRVYVDGAVLGEGDAPITVRCGRHDVRIGSHGELRAIDVPCGGDVYLAP